MKTLVSPETPENAITLAEIKMMEYDLDVYEFVVIQDKQNYLWKYSEIYNEWVSIEGSNLEIWNTKGTHAEMIEHLEDCLKNKHEVKVFHDHDHEEMINCLLYAGKGK